MLRCLATVAFSAVVMMIFALRLEGRLHFLLKISCLSVTTWGKHFSGQSGALRHGISKALQFFDPNLRPLLKSGMIDMFSLYSWLAFLVGRLPWIVL